MRSVVGYGNSTRHGGMVPDGYGNRTATVAMGIAARGRFAAAFNNSARRQI